MTETSTADSPRPLGLVRGLGLPLTAAGIPAYAWWHRHRV